MGIFFVCLADFWGKIFNYELKLENSYHTIIRAKYDLKLLKEIRIQRELKQFRSEVDTNESHSLKIWYFSILSKCKLFL